MIQRLNALLNAAQTICSSLKIEEILERLIQEICNIMEKTDAILVFLYDEELNLLVPYRTYGLDSSKADLLRIAPGETIAGKVLQTKRSILLTSREAAIQAMSTMTGENLKAYHSSLGQPVYPESVVCTPMLYRNECLGVITIDRFIPDMPYTESDVQVFESIASLASTALANSRMYRQAHESWQMMSDLNEQLKNTHHQLNHAIAINKALAVTSLRGQGLETICNTLSHMLETNIIICNDSQERIAYNESFREHVELFSNALQTDSRIFSVAGNTLKPYLCRVGGLRTYLCPISDGNVLFGYAVFTGYREEDFSLIQNASGLSCLLLAIELMRLEREQQIREEYISESLNELLKGHLDGRLLKRLQEISPDIGRGKYIIILMDLEQTNSLNMPEGKELIQSKRFQRLLLKKISFHVPRPIYTRKDNSIIALYTFSRSYPDSRIYEDIRTLYTELQKELYSDTVRLHISCGRVAENVEHLPDSMTDARMGMQYLHAVPGSRSILFFHQLGLRKLLFRHNQEELEQFYRDILEPVLCYDHEKKADLIKTIEQFKQCGHSVQHTAGKLNIHKNTLNYRIRKIKELLGGENGFEPSWSDIELAVDIKKFLEEIRYD